MTPWTIRAWWTLLAIGWLSFTWRAYLVESPAPGWDEGVHLTNAIEAFRVIRGGSLKELLLFLDAPSYYPFVHYLLIALSWALFGFGEAVARLPALATTLLVVPGLWWLARETIAPDDRPAAWLIATALTLTSPEMLRNQGLIMLDATGTCATVWATVAWVRWLKVDSWSRATWTVVAVLAAFFTKYNYAVVLAVVLVVHGLSVRAGVRRLSRVCVLLVGPALLWLYQEPVKKFSLLTEYLWNRIHEKALWAQLLYPVRAAVLEHAAWSWIGVVVLIAYAWSWRRLRVREVEGVLLLAPLVYGLSLSLSSSQLSRYLLPAAPILALAAASTMAYAVRRGGLSRRLVDVALLALVVALLRPAASVLDAAYVHRAELGAARTLLAERFDGAPFVLVGGFAQFPPSLGRFDGMLLAKRRTGELDFDARPLVTPCPPAYQYTRTRLLPLSEQAAVKIVDEGLDAYRDEYGEELPLAVVTVAPTSSMHDNDYENYNAWQEVVANIVEATRTAGERTEYADGGFTLTLYH